MSLDALRALRNSNLDDIQPTVRLAPKVNKRDLVLAVRKVIFYTCFALMLGWNLYCLVFSLPALVSMNANLASVASPQGNLWSALSFAMVYAAVIANWFFPTVGLGIIAITAKPSDLLVKAAE